MRRAVQQRSSTGAYSFLIAGNTAFAGLDDTGIARNKRTDTVFWLFLCEPGVGKFFVEFINPAGCVHELHFAREERM
ncbi:MAG: hypothetical protein RL386_1495 [Bacteroidota bacterium]|jgi:hypothetical protein